MNHSVFDQIKEIFTEEKAADIANRTASPDLESYVQSHSRTKLLLREAIKVAVANPSLSIPSVAFYPWGYTELAHRLDAAHRHPTAATIEYALEALVVELTPKEKLEALCNLSHTTD